MTPIEEYYSKMGLPTILVKNKVASFDKHSDIKGEFEEWISTGSYKETDAIEVEGYTAKSLAEISEYLDGEGAFSLLVQLREDPDKAKDRISRGFVMK